MKKLILFILITVTVSAQKKVLDHSDYTLWSTVQGDALSPNGEYIVYSLEKGEKDNFLKLKSVNGNAVFEHERAEKGKFTYDSNYLLFTIKAWKDSVTAMKSRKVKKKDLPKDSLGILNLKNKTLVKIGQIKSYQLPEEWTGYVAYELEEISKKKGDKNLEEDKDSIPKKKEKKGKSKKVGKKTGYHVVLRNLESQKEDTLKFVTDFTFAKKGKWFAYTTTGIGKGGSAGVFVVNLENGQKIEIHNAKKAKYAQLAFSESGKNLGFVVDTDTTKIQVRPNQLFLWQEGKAKAEKLADASSTPKGYLVSADGDVSFSKDESKLFFGLRKPPIIKDTTLTNDEIVNVEVWTYDEPVLYTVQELQLKNDTIASFRTVIHLNNKTKLIPLGDSSFTETEIGDEGNALYALSSNSTPYDLERQWTGGRIFDYRIVNTKTGEVGTNITKAPQLRLSPRGAYAFGYDRIDSTWVTYNTGTGASKALTKGKLFYDELNDSPNFPSAYGLAGFTKDDVSIILYDRYDLWEFNPKTGEGNRLTKGRETKTSYRYVELDSEERFLDPKAMWFLTTFNEGTKDAGYVSFNPKSKKLTELVSGPYRYANAKKAKLDDNILFTRESFQEFPDLRVTGPSFKKVTVLSNANPQQANYNWGTIELTNWTSLDGKPLRGLLVKPENFDPNKKYPMMVNFYERNSDGVHRHRYPKPERSTINYSFFASRGYVIFNPDVEYRIGYPGESAYNCVVPGVTSLIGKGFVDKDNIGVQGHSWGGYQIAYLVTKTDIFKAAEAGAPVPNMISAYGGIRWWTGLSRQFQYEHTQSRIGGTPWEYPQRYVENSPIFNIDKIHTPLLIMANDADGHVPWYQGIEFFMSLRRLSKPAWFLNYNGEPHWPLKFQNRTDFSIRMSQFFDHYLQDAPEPMWMVRGVPAMEKGVNQGYELIKDGE